MNMRPRIAPLSHLFLFAPGFPGFFFGSDEALKGHGKKIAEKAQRNEPFSLREHEAAWIDGRCVSRAGFYCHDPGVCVRAHGNANDVLEETPPRSANIVMMRS